MSKSILNTNFEIILAIKNIFLKNYTFLTLLIIKKLLL